MCLFVLSRPAFLAYVSPLTLTLARLPTPHGTGVAALSTDLTDGQVLQTLSPEGAALRVDLSDGVTIDAVGNAARLPPGSS